MADNTARNVQFRDLQGLRVGIALADGSCLLDAEVVSVSRAGNSSVWLDVAGEDVFVLPADVTGVWVEEIVKAA